MEKIVSSTGYFRRKSTGESYGSPMYLGIYDSESNYEEISKDDYDKYVAEQEAEAEANAK